MSSVVHRGAVVVSAALAVSSSRRPSPGPRTPTVGYSSSTSRSCSSIRPSSSVRPASSRSSPTPTWSGSTAAPGRSSTPIRSPASSRPRHGHVAAEPGLVHADASHRRARLLRAEGAEGDGASVVYGRVARPPGAIVLQYWYFYYDNTYSYAYPPSNFIWQAHEGDWEVVNVVLSEDEEPQFVGYSQHCRGQRRSWSDDPQLDTHPVVHVAAGSHANYFSAGAHPDPDRVHPACGDRLPPGGRSPAAGRPLVRRRRGRRAARRWRHVHAREEIEDGHPSWVAFQGLLGRAPVLPRSGADRHGPLRDLAERPRVPRRVGSIHSARSPAGPWASRLNAGRA